MPNPSALLNEATRTAGAVSVLYSATVMIAALTALLARTSTRRRAAVEVLKVLLRRRGRRR